MDDLTTLTLDQLLIRADAQHQRAELDARGAKRECTRIHAEIVRRREAGIWVGPRPSE